MEGKRPATIQVDVDSLHAIAENAGLNIGGTLHCPVYESAIPEFLDLFNAFNIKATFFVIGRDVLLQKNRKILLDVVKQGHEIANHTMSHITSQPFFSLTLEQKSREITLCHRAISEYIGVKPVGFKSPAYAALSSDSLGILKEMGYLYDSSSMPLSMAGPLSFVQSLAREKTGICYWGDSQVQCGYAGIKQVQISTVPLFRMPFNSTFVFMLGTRWFNLGYSFKKREEGYLNYLFHAIDLLGRNQIDPRMLGIFGLNYSLKKKKSLCMHILGRIKEDYHLMPTKDLIGCLN